ncbi:MAG: hypothetical protein LAN18_08740 [Acidobacteriia bacterium]|nr:hypothetical protein [Terriglobia bacterium]
MNSKKKMTEQEPEIAAIGTVYKALEKLAPEAQARVLSYVRGKLKINAPIPEQGNVGHPKEAEDTPATIAIEGTPEGPKAEEDGLEGISPVAKKWMTRNGLKAQTLSAIFSLGGDEIDLIAKAIPGKSKRDRMHSVLLLKGIAAYLGSGAARFTHEQLKEACLHYKAYDAANFATSLKSFSAEVSGDKSTAYVLTPRGLSSATDIVKKMLESDKSS